MYMVEALLILKHNLSNRRRAMSVGKLQDSVVDSVLPSLWADLVPSSNACNTRRLTPRSSFITPKPFDFRDK